MAYTSSPSTRWISNSTPSHSAAWRAADCVEHDVQVANNGKHEDVVKPDVVSNYSLNYREDRPAYDKCLLSFPVCAAISLA
jgi:hypothetical protein